MPSIQQISWVPPQELVYKANVDGVVFLDLKAMGIGTVIKNEKGSVVVALSRKISHRWALLKLKPRLLKWGYNLLRM